MKPPLPILILALLTGCKIPAVATVSPPTPIPLVQMLSFASETNAQSDVQFAPQYLEITMRSYGTYQQGFYFLQRSFDLKAWALVATNALYTTLTVTDIFSSPMQFYRSGFGTNL